MLQRDSKKVRGRSEGRHTEAGPGSRQGSSLRLDLLWGKIPPSPKPPGQLCSAALTLGSETFIFPLDAASAHLHVLFVPFAWFTLLFMGPYPDPLPAPSQRENQLMEPTD